MCAAAATSHCAAARESIHVQRNLVGAMAVASALAVANLYYNQPMLADIGRTFGVDAHAAGLVATFTQVGYAAGMPLFIPLGDLVERRRLVVALFGATAVALALAALAPTLALLIGASFLIGLTTVIAQILIPLATELAAPEEQGRTIGAILSGVLIGILLARTVSGYVAKFFGWRAMYAGAAVVALLAGAAMRLLLPRVEPSARTRYRDLIRSLARIARGSPKLRQVSLTAALLFASFSAFWTTLVFRLETPPYHYGSDAAGLFGLVGATGAVVAPLAGRLADRRSPRFVVSNAIAVVFAAFLVFWLAGERLWGLVIGVILLDAGVQGAQVANQSRVLKLRLESRNRVNTLYMICYFAGASGGSLAGTQAWARWGWTGVCVTGLLLMAAAAGVLAARGPSEE
jgi:predicted MFS family arabinose efflux permease